MIDVWYDKEFIHFSFDMQEKKAFYRKSIEEKRRFLMAFYHTMIMKTQNVDRRHKFEEMIGLMQEAGEEKLNFIFSKNLEARDKSLKQEIDSKRKQGERFLIETTEKANIGEERIWSVNNQLKTYPGDGKTTYKILSTNSE